MTNLHARFNHLILAKHGAPAAEANVLELIHGEREKMQPYIRPRVWPDFGKLISFTEAELEKFGKLVNKFMALA